MSATTYPNYVQKNQPSGWRKFIMAFVAIIIFLGIAVPLAQNPNPPSIDDIWSKINQGCSIVVNLDDYVFEPLYQNGKLVSVVAFKKGVPKELLSVFYNLEPSMDQFKGVSELAWKGTVEHKVTNLLLGGEAKKLLRATDLYIARNSDIWVRNFNDQNRFGFGSYLACGRMLSDIILHDNAYKSAFLIIP